MPTHDIVQTQNLASQHIPEWWRETTLGEVCDKIWDGLHGTPNYSDDWEYFFINGNNIENWKIVIKNDTKKVSFVEYEKYKKNLSSRTILMWINGTVWNLAKFQNERCILGKSAAYLNIKDDINVDFIYYLMMDNVFQFSISKNANWSTIKNVWLSQLRSYRFLLPPLPEQRAIADMLSSLDAKIEILREQNETLEKTAQTIFQEWFGKYSIDDELPEGWRVVKVSDFGKIVCGKTPPKDNPDFFWWDIPFIKIPDMHDEVYIVKTDDTLTDDWANTQKNKFIPKNSICVSCIATVGLVVITSENSQTNQQINSLIPNEDFYLEYLYFSFWNIKDELIAIWSGGSATLNINTSVFSNIEILFPEEQILEKFHELTKPMFGKILSNLLQIQSLSKSRDTLLPKLMAEGINWLNV
jgi:type I restriction enzyme S subunit